MKTHAHKLGGSFQNDGTCKIREHTQNWTHTKSNLIWCNNVAMDTRDIIMVYYKLWCKNYIDGNFQLKVVASDGINIHPIQTVNRYICEYWIAGLRLLVYRHGWLGPIFVLYVINVVQIQNRNLVRLLSRPQKKSRHGGTVLIFSFFFFVIECVFRAPYLKIIL